MTIPSHPDEPPIRSYIRLLQRLHALIAEGKGDSEEADAIRDEMDRPGYALTRQEHDRVNGLSADLYALAEGGVKPVAMTPPEGQRWGEELADAFQQGNWDRVLQLLRRPSSDVASDRVAFMQARCWEHLGHLDIALLFMREAERRNPEHAVSVLTYLQKLNRTAEAEACANRILNDGKSPADAEARRPASN